jgi:hypothetical protein
LQRLAEHKDPDPGGQIRDRAPHNPDAAAAALGNLSWAWVPRPPGLMGSCFAGLKADVDTRKVGGFKSRRLHLIPLCAAKVFLESIQERLHALNMACMIAFQLKDYRVGQSFGKDVDNALQPVCGYRALHEQCGARDPR